MATTAAKAFEEFRAKLLLTTAQSNTVNARRDVVAGHLRTGFPNSSNLPLSRTKMIGSAGRETIIRPLHDIDLLAVFENKDNIFETYRYNSQAFLYRVRDVLNAHSSVQVVGARGQAVRFFYVDDPFVDIAPVFVRSEGGFLIPDGSNGWLATDPEYHTSYMSQRNTELNSQLKPRIRMAKRWNAVHSHYFNSFHLECVMANVFTSMSTNSRDGMAKFFEWAQNNVTVYDPAGHSGDLSSYLTWPNRQSLISNLESARNRAVNAVAAESRGDHQEAIRLWRIIFGGEFPVYG